MPSFRRLLWNAHSFSLLVNGHEKHLPVVGKALPLELGAVEQSAQREDWSGASSALSRSYDGWAARQTYLHIVAEHDAVDSADALYRRCAAFIAAQDGAELSSELAGLSHQLGLLAEMERFSIKNIL